MALNPSRELADVTSAIDIRQSQIAILEIALNDAISGDDFETMAQLRVDVSRLKASLGQLRNTQSFLVQETNDEKSARQKQGELAKG